MKQLVVLSIILQLVLLPLVLGGQDVSERITIRRIKVAEADQERERLVRTAFVEWQEGDSLTREELEQWLPRLESRLLSWGYYSSVLVQALPSSASPDAWNIVVEIQDGYPFRFSGGPIYAGIGMLNLFDSGHDVDLVLGLNIQSLQWRWRMPDTRGFRLFGAISNRELTRYGPLGQDSEARKVQDLSARAGMAKDLGWGWDVEASGGISSDWLPAEGLFTPTGRIGLGLGWEEVDRQGFWGPYSPSAGIAARTGMTAISALTDIGQVGGQAKAELRAYLPLSFIGSTLASLVYAEVAFGPLVQTGYLHRQMADPVRLRRAPLEDSVSADILGGSLEFRTRLGSSPLFDFTRAGLEAFLQGDLAFIPPSDIWSGQAGGRLVGAFGGGVRLFVGSPVHVPFTLALSADEELRPLVIFDSSLSF